MQSIDDEKAVSDNALDETLDSYGRERSNSFMSAAEQQELKQAVKEAVREAMIENSDLLKDLLVEVLEDTALLRRMEEGRQTELI